MDTTSGKQPPEEVTSLPTTSTPSQQATTSGSENSAPPKKKKNRWFLYILLFVCTFVIPIIPAFFFLIFYMFIARPFQVSGNAMAPNFLSGQYYLASVITYKFTSPTRGDVVIFHNSLDERKDFIKRIIGIPGDKISLHEGKVSVNGQILDESSYLAADVHTGGGPFLPDEETVELRPEQYFMLGDNRTTSSDSREWGFIPREGIIGKMTFCYYNCNPSTK